MSQSNILKTKNDRLDEILKNKKHIIQENKIVDNSQDISHIIKKFKVLKNYLYINPSKLKKGNYVKYIKKDGSYDEKDYISGGVIVEIIFRETLNKRIPHKLQLYGVLSKKYWYITIANYYIFLGCGIKDSDNLILEKDDNFDVDDHFKILRNKDKFNDVTIDVNNFDIDKYFNDIRDSQQIKKNIKK